MEDTFNFTTVRPKQIGFYYVKWSPGEKARKVYIRYYPETGGDSPHYEKEHWTWAVDPSEPPEDREDIEADVTNPELIEFSERVFS